MGMEVPPRPQALSPASGPPPVATTRRCLSGSHASCDAWRSWALLGAASPFVHVLLLMLSCSPATGQTPIPGGGDLSADMPWGGGGWSLGSPSPAVEPWRGHGGNRPPDYPLGAPLWAPVLSMWVAYGPQRR